jgi:hypothetical protein
MKRTQTIRSFNDLLRKYGHGGRIMLTAGIRAQGEAHLLQIMQRVREFKDFSPDNDPHGEHDFGGFEYEGQSYFWKIDYYDHAYRQHSEDPADPVLTKRVLTIMLAQEY